MQLHGVRNILRFNWPMYALAALVAMASLFFFPNPLSIAAFIVAVYFSVASVWASHLVYDTPTIYSWEWIVPVLGDAKTILNVHAGFDETTAGLPRRVYPFVFGEAETRSIARARKHDASIPFHIGALPCLASSVDAILFLFAAHEIRSPAERVRSFADAGRALRDGGRVVLLEHLRDASTLAVFGPGAFHFYSRREWLRVADAAQLTVVAEADLTPFAHYFVFERCSTRTFVEIPPRT
jgi:SAM-dependent methyltransferase